MKYVFVDGYNVVGSWSILKSLKKYNFDAARDKLIEILQNYSVYCGCLTVIVFDAHMVKGSIEKKEKASSNVSVVFTKEGETADSYIEKTVDSIGRKFDVLVVTSDSLEQQVTFQRGATRMSSSEFYYEVQSVEKVIHKRIHKAYSQKKNSIEDNIEEEILEKLEKIRRSD